MPAFTSTQRRLLLLTGLLLLVAASRMFRLDHQMNVDEVWSVWQTFGSPADILRWTPYDWPPLYYLTVGGWKALVGFHPFVLRTLSVLAFMVGTTFAYRLGRRLRGTRQGDRLGFLLALVYAALGYSLFLSIYVRAYVFVMALLPLAFWLTLRYFDRPTLRRAVALAVCLAAMFYIHLNSPMGFLMIGLYTLVAYGRRVWRWWLPGVLSGLLVAPLLAEKLSLTTRRVAATRTLSLPPLPQALADLFQDYSGSAYVLWTLLFLLATILIGGVALKELNHRMTMNWATHRWMKTRGLNPLLGCSPVRIYRAEHGGNISSSSPRFSVSLFLCVKSFSFRLALVALLWTFGAPIAMYFLNPVLGFFGAQYSWWIMLGLALWLAVGLACLPRPAVALVSVVMLGAMFVQIPFERYDIPGPPFQKNFEWLQDHLHPGDVMMFDPLCQCGAAEQWDYFKAVYFPNGIDMVTSPAGHRRIWYVSSAGQHDPATVNALLEEHINTGQFIGPSGFLFRLYEGPPDTSGVLFENGMRFHGADIVSLDGLRYESGPIARREGQPVRVRLWWSADQAIGLDYSEATYLLNKVGGRRIAQFDGPPQISNGPQATSRWTTGRYYVEEREITLPYPLASNEFDIALTVYQWWDNTRIAAPGVDENDLLYLGTVTVKAW